MTAFNRTTYTRQLADGSHEYGEVEQVRGRRDRMIPRGTLADYEAAERARRALAEAQRT